MQVAAVITAGGSGTRFGTVRPKQFAELCGKMLIEHTLEAFDLHPWISEMIAVLPQTEIEFFQTQHRQLRGGKKLTITAGGATRQESVRLGLNAIESKPQYVAIHDAARCLITQNEITQTIQKCIDGWQGAICATPVHDTLKKVESEKILHTVSREHLWAMQTPQVFEFPLIQEAYEKAHREKCVATDDAQIAELMNARVCVVQGLPTNLKITYPDDLKIAQVILQNRNNVG